MKFTLIINQLTQTAYYTKYKLSHKRVEEAVKDFFSTNFEGFIGKHTNWELLYHPPDVTPNTLNKTKLALIKIFRDEFSIDDLSAIKDTNIFH